MAQPEQALEDRLTSYAGLTALISTRVYPVVLPQNPTKPAITYQRVGGDREHGMTVDYGLAHPVIQVDVWASTFPSARAVAEQVELALLRYENAASTPVILDVLPENEGIDDYEDATKLWRHTRDWRIWYRPS